jgi:glycogen synthase
LEKTDCETKEAIMVHPFQLLSWALFVLLRYETEHVPCTGVTAVTRQERRAFRGGVMIAPWHGDMSQASGALADRLVVDTGVVFALEAWGGKRCRILASNDGHMPTLYLAVDGQFGGRRDPYDTPELKSDTLWFGLAVARLFELVRATEGDHVLRGIWASGADWLTVPTLHLLRRFHMTGVLTLHSVLDQCLRAEADAFGDCYAAFRSSRTALQIGMEEASVVTAVNQGFAMGLREDPVHREVLAKHLQPWVDRVIGVDNGPFAPLDRELDALRAQLRDDPAKGVERLCALKAQALQALPEELRRRAQGKLLFVSMGRRSAQKQHDVLVDCLRTLLHRDPSLPIFTVFATTVGGEGDAERLALMRELADAYPDHALCLDGRLDSFKQLLDAAVYNVMPSLFEPHGGAFGGLVVPVARAVDGLAAQISAFQPTGRAADINSRWHAREQPNGLLFREEPLEDTERQSVEYQELLTRHPSPHNETFRRMSASLLEVIGRAIDVYADRPTYVRLVAGALERQASWSWRENLAMMRGVVCARQKRPNHPSPAASFA